MKLYVENVWENRIFSVHRAAMIAKIGNSFSSNAYILTTSYVT